MSARLARQITKVRRSFSPSRVHPAKFPLIANAAYCVHVVANGIVLSSTRAGKREPDPKWKCAHILRLPVELIEWIASYLDRTELLDLRYACRDLEARTSSITASTFFKDRTFLMADEYSLDTLCEISRHPLYQKSIKVIRLSLLTLRRTHAEWSNRCGPSCYTRMMCGPPNTRADRAYNRRLSEGYKECISQEDKFQIGKDIEYLPAALVNFMRAGNVPRVSTSTRNEVACRVPPDWDCLDRVTSYRDCLTLEYEIERPFEIIHRALVDAAFPIRKLRLGHLIAPAPLAPFLYRGSPTTFAHLRHLRLDIVFTMVYRGETDRAVFDKAYGERQGLLRVVSEAQNLETFALGVLGEPERAVRLAEKYRGVFPWLVCGQIESLPKPFQHLRSLDLEEDDMMPDLLLRFIEDHRSTLESFYVDGIIDGKSVHPEFEETIRSAAETTGIRLSVQGCYARTFWTSLQVNPERR